MEQIGIKIVRVGIRAFKTGGFIDIVGCLFGPGHSEPPASRSGGPLIMSWTGGGRLNYFFTGVF